MWTQACRGRQRRSASSGSAQPQRSGGRRSTPDLPCRNPRSTLQKGIGAPVQYDREAAQPSPAEPLRHLGSPQAAGILGTHSSATVTLSRFAVNRRQTPLAWTAGNKRCLSPGRDPASHGAIISTFPMHPIAPGQSAQGIRHRHLAVLLTLEAHPLYYYSRHLRRGARQLS